MKGRVKVRDGSHTVSQSDYLDESMTGMFPPAPTVQSKPKSTYDGMMRGGGGSGSAGYEPVGPAPANSVLGGFGLF